MRAEQGWPTGYTASPEDRRAILVLASLRSLTPRKLLEMAGRRDSASACLAAIRSGREGTAGDRALARERDPAVLEGAVRRCGARLVAAGDPEYPASLLDLADPPAALFVRGGRLGDLAPRVAVVGARSCTALGAEISSAIGSALAAVGVCTVSGAARGIDAAAHEGSLRGGGPTLAVLGCGIDEPLPATARRLLARIRRSGAVVSEYAPGVAPEPRRFPARNRVIAALSEALVVVEGGDRSGSMITTEHALDIGRRVFAVPGALNNPKAHAPLTLLREGATPIRGPEDLLADLGYAAPQDAAADGPPASAEAPPGLSGEERLVWERIGAARLAEAVAAETGLPLDRAVAALMGLEVRGLVRSVGGRYERRFVGISPPDETARRRARPEGSAETPVRPTPSA